MSRSVSSINRGTWRSRVAAWLCALLLPVLALPAAAQTCAPIFSESFGFGSGSTLIGPALPAGQTTYRYEDTRPPCIGPDCRVNDGEYSLVQSPRRDGGNGAWRDGSDHTGGGNGYMMLVNADFDPGVFYTRTFTGLAVGVRHEFTAWLTNLQDYGPGDGDIDPNVTFRVVDPATGTVLGSVSTGDIPELPGSQLVWNEYGVSFVATQSTLRLEVVNNSPGGQGNDLALDDITLTALGTDCTNDVVLSKNVRDANGNGIAEPGERLDYSITLRNTGNLTAINYDLIDNLDPNTVYVSSDNGGVHDGAASGGTLTWRNLSIAPGATVTLNAVVNVVDPIPAGVQRILNRAYNPDRGPPDCSSDPSLPGCAQIPTAAMVTLSKTLSAESGNVAGRAEAGETLSYTLTLTNRGGAQASNHAFYELLPAHTTLVSVGGANLSGCAVGDTGGKPCLLTVAGPIGGNGGSASVSFVVRVVDPIPAKVVGIYNLVTDDTSTPPPACDPSVDPNGCVAPPPGCNPVTDPNHCVQTPVIRPTVIVAKRLGAESGRLTGQAEPGETLTYTLTLTNGSAASAGNHSFYELLPAHTTLVSVTGASVSGCNIGDTGARACTLIVAGPIAGNGGTAQASFVVRVADPIPAGVVAIYNLITDDTDKPPPTRCDPATDPNGCTAPPPGCDAASDPDHCVNTPVSTTLSLDKDVQGQPQRVAGTADEFVVRYTIAVRNQGAAVGRYDLSDAPRLGAGVTVLSASATRNGQSVSISGIGPWQLASARELAGGASDAYVLEARVRVAVSALNDPSANACLAGSTGRGLYNEAVLTIGGHTQRDDACIDTPLPSTQAVLSVEKVGSVREAEVGDLVTYSVRVRNQGTGFALNPVLVDRLPAGFRLVDGTVQVRGATLTALLGAPGPVLRIGLDRLGPGGEALVRYRVRIGVGAQQGDGINRVRAECVEGASVKPCSNESQWRVEIRGGVFSDEGCLVGQVFVDCNVNSVKDREELGIPGVRMYLEDGTYLISDVEGKYSYCGLRPVTHVLKVDSTSLPVGSRLTTSSNRNAGDAHSLFVDLKNGEMQRADFIEGSCGNPVLEQVKARRANGEARSVETESGQPALRFQNKPAGAPQQATESANQAIERSRQGDMP